MNPTDARLVLPAEIAAFVDSDRKLFVVSGPLNSGRRRLIEAGLRGVPESTIAWDSSTYSDRFCDILRGTEAPILVISDFNVFDPNARQADWYAKALAELVEGRAVTPYQYADREESDSSDPDGPGDPCRYTGKIILVTEPQSDSASASGYSSVEGVEYYDSAFDLHNYVHRAAEALCRDHEADRESLSEVLGYLRTLCLKAPELTTKPAPDAGTTLGAVMHACDTDNSPKERQFVVGRDIHQYVLARDAAGVPASAVDEWETWDYAGCLETDGLRALILIPSVLQWFAESDYDTYLLACPKDGFTRAHLRAAAERAAADLVIEEPAGPAELAAALEPGRGGGKSVVWIDPEQAANVAETVTLEEVPRLLARESLSDRVGRLVWFPAYYAERTGLSLRELEELYPQLYGHLEADRLAAIDRSQPDLPTPDELVKRVIGR